MITVPVALTRYARPGNPWQGWEKTGVTARILSG